jgi:hypothetical protein
VTGSNNNLLSIDQLVAKRKVEFQFKPTQIQDNQITLAAIHPGAYYFVQRKSDKALYLIKKLSDIFKTHSAHQYLAQKFKMMPINNNEDVKDILCAGEIYIGTQNTILGWSVVSPLYEALKLSDFMTFIKATDQSGLPLNAYLDLPLADVFEKTFHDRFFAKEDGHLLTLYGVEDLKAEQEKRAAAETFDASQYKQRLVDFYQRVKTNRDEGDLIPPPKQMIPRETMPSNPDAVTEAKAVLGPITKGRAGASSRNPYGLLAKTIEEPDQPDSEPQELPPVQGLKKK